MRQWVMAMLAAALAVPALADKTAGVAAWARGDDTVAVDEWRAAADQGNADAQFNLGQAYMLGRGAPADTGKAEEYYRLAAIQGHEQATDSYGLALFENGKTLAAIPYLEIAVARGERRAEYILGTMLFNGTDLPRNWVRAYALVTRSAQAGLPQARETLAQMDRYIPVEERARGLALAALTAPSAGDGARRDGRTVALPPATPVSPLRTRIMPPPPPPPPPPPKTRRPPPPLVEPAIAGPWRLQLGAFVDPAHARGLWNSVSGRFRGRVASYERAGAYTRLLVGPFASRAQARATCGTLDPCQPVGP